MQIKTVENIIELIEKKITLYKKNKIDLALSGLSYFTFSSNTPSKLLVDFYLTNKYLYLIEILKYIKNFLSIIKIYNYSIILNNKKIKNSRIIISWCKQIDFDKNGYFYDSYFNIKSNNKNFFFLLISMDGFVPKNINNNITIIYNKKTNFLKYIYNFFLYLKDFFSSLLIRGIYFSHYFNWHSIFAIKMYNLSKDLFDSSIIKEIYIPYEGQPFQKFITKNIKSKNNSIKIIGYAHMILTPIPGNLYYMDGAPDELLVAGIDQKKILTKYFNWSPKKIKVILSFRFLKFTNKNMLNKIFLPIYIFNYKKILNSLEDYLLNADINSMNQLSVINHPQTLEFKLHKTLIEDINKLLFKYKNRFVKKINKDLNCSFFIGNTSAIIEALERGLDKGIHITNNHYYDIYNKNLWPSVETIQLSKNVYLYKMIAKNNFIKFGDDKDAFIKYTNN